jgi:hypothetical protein
MKPPPNPVFDPPDAAVGDRPAAMPALPSAGPDAGPVTSADGAPPSGSDLRLLLPAAAVWGTAALTLGASAAVIWGVVAVAVAGGTALLARGHRARRVTAGTLLVCVAASAAGVGVRVAAVRSGPVRDLARHGARAVVDAVVTGDPVERRRPGRRTNVGCRPVPRLWRGTEVAWRPALRVWRGADVA